MEYNKKSKKIVKSYWLIVSFVVEYTSAQSTPVWWNWQTCWTQNPVVAIPCRFDPDHRHQKSRDSFRCLCFFATADRLGRADLHALRGKGSDPAFPPRLDALGGKFRCLCFFATVVALVELTSTLCLSSTFWGIYWCLYGCLICSFLARVGKKRTKETPHRGRGFVRKKQTGRIFAPFNILPLVDPPLAV